MGGIISGFVIFMSDIWSGRATDKFIKKHCGSIEPLDEGQNVMVEGGFDIQDFVSQKKITVNIPPTFEWGT